MRRENIVKILVVYYSRTGNTRKIAEELAEALGADIEELKEHANRAGAKGYMLAGRDAMKKRPAELLPLEHDAASYDLVVLGGPCWAGSMCTPTRTYGIEQKDRLSRVAFFATGGDSRFAKKALSSIGEATNITPVATLALGEKDVTNDHSEALADFVAALKAAG
jgi:flavodoxin